MTNRTLPTGMLLLLLLTTGCIASAGPKADEPNVMLTGLLPKAAKNDEKKLLANAQAAKIETLKGGYRQVDLVVARAATWNDDRDLLVRLFLPPAKDGRQENVSQALPLVAYVHGGGFIGGNPKMELGSKKGFSRPVRALLDDGFAVASLGYRLAREAGWPAPISDTLCGLRFLKQHGKHWGVDASRIGVCGHSAGARIAALLSMVPQDAFHTQDLPWKGESISFAATWLWAGSAWTAPQIESWEEFGKPKNFSVMRLHFGEHPAWDTMARHRLRLRNVLPHISNAMPPLHLLRGKSDYGGDHSDAGRAVELWKALGIEAELSVVPGGHSSTGPAESTVAFFKRHLVTRPFSPPARRPFRTAEVLLKQGEAAAALEVLSADLTTRSGRTPPPGEWMILQDGVLIWLPQTDSWPGEARKLAGQARSVLAEAEGKAAKELLKRRRWFGAQQAARNVRRLVGEQDAMQSLLKEVDAASSHEESVFRTLAKANEHVHAGRHDQAIKQLASVDDKRTRAAAERIRTKEQVTRPDWATSAGIDVFGRWAELALLKGVPVRMRWVAPGQWDLPEPFRYRNSTKQPWVKQGTVKHGFWLAETPTTIAQWQAIQPGEVNPKSGRANIPQTGIDYLQIIDWLKRLSDKHKGMVARLPSEQEWLHAATLGGRADVRAATDLHAVHALNVDPNDPGPLGVHKVLPSLGGFYGMLGGVHEWTSSPGRHTARFTDSAGRFRVMAYPIARGGAWSSMPHTLGPGIRRQHRHGNRQPDLGFRFAIGGGPDAADWLSDVERK
ncbi:MAG: SUMF1/EgtB/PvdO family nonheme iron enzyme [Phycisphaerae bacterium]